jgi:hypothetical protein
VQKDNFLQNILMFCLLPAVPLMLMVLVFNVPQFLPGVFLPGLGIESLGYIMQAQFLAASSGILLIIPLLFHVPGKYSRWLRRGVFAIFGFGFAWLAYDVDGTAGMVFYTLLVFLTYGGGTLLVFDWLSGVSRTFLSLLRWSTAIFFYVTYQLELDLDIDFEVWKNTVAVIPFGAMYFATLLVFEVFAYPALTWHLEKKLQHERTLLKAQENTRFGQGFLS